MAQPLMPHATASWLVDNTALSFEQIAEFCGLHILEVQAIADDTAGTKLTGRDPVRAHELTHGGDREGPGQSRTTSCRCPRARSRRAAPRGRATRPVSKRQDKPDGIAWIIRNHPEVSDGAIGKLIGTTRTTIAAIRDRTHWNIANITPKDPVTLGLCSQRELDAVVAKAAKTAGHRGAGRRAAVGRPRRADRGAARAARCRASSAAGGSRKARRRVRATACRKVWSIRSSGNDQAGRLSLGWPADTRFYLRL